MLNQTVISRSLTYFLWHTVKHHFVFELDSWRELGKSEAEWTQKQKSEPGVESLAVVETCKVRSGLTLMEGIFSSSGFSTVRTLIWVCVCYPIEGIQWGGAVLDSDTEQIPKLFSLLMVATEAPAIPMPAPPPPTHTHKLYSNCSGLMITGCGKVCYHSRVHHYPVFWAGRNNKNCKKGIQNYNLISLTLLGGRWEGGGYQINHMNQGYYMEQCYIKSQIFLFFFVLATFQWADNCSEIMLPLKKIKKSHFS